MEYVVPKTELLESPVSATHKIELRWRKDIESDRLSDRELDVLCPVLPELVGELLQMSRDLNDKE